MGKQKLYFFTIRFLMWIVPVACSSVSTEAQTVYVTKTGKKYHSADCRHLSKSSFPISLSDAVNKGYTPCSVCSQSVVSNDSAKVNRLLDAPKVNPSPPAKPTSSQCTGRTKEGLRCKRTTTSPSGKCWQHQ